MNETAADKHLLACAHAVVRLQSDGQRAWWACDDCGTPFAPAGPPTSSIDASPAREYLSIRQLAGRIPYSEGAIRNMMSRGIFRLGIHYTKPNGGRPVFQWTAVQEWTRAEPAQKHRAG